MGPRSGSVKAPPILTEVAAGKSIPELNADLHAARDDGNLAGLDVDDAELSPEPELSLLRYEEHLAVSVVEILVLHRAGNEIEVRAHASLSAGVAGRGDCAHTFQKRKPLIRDGDRIPSHGCDWHINLRTRRGAP